MIGLMLAGALMAADPNIEVVQTQAAAEAASPQEPVSLEDVEVVGRPLDTMIRNFVNEVAAPNAGRGLASWRGSICIGVANLKAEPAQYIVDRVSTVADDLGLSAGGPGCSPNVMIIATNDARSLASTLVEERTRAFRMGGSGMDRGGAALRAFRTSDKPVRWWQVSMPVNSETGERATRIPGECSNACRSPTDAAPIIPVFAASRLSSQIVDDIFRTVVIIDVDQVSDVSIQQLADYVAMVTFAQIDPDADTSGYASVLNVFEDPEAADGLTDWDTAYLQGLYSAERTRRDTRASRSEVVASIRRSHARLREEEGEE